jgi:prevent-host-death family protein
MKTVGSYEAKTHLPRLLGLVEKGATITITKRGKPIAVLSPAPEAGKPDVKTVIAEMLAYRDQHGPKLDGLTIKEMIEEGRR